MEKKESKRTDAETFIAEIQRLNLAIEDDEQKIRIEKYDANNIVYSKLESALTRVETWLPFLQKQIDLCTQFGYGTLSGGEDVMDSEQDGSYRHHYTLNAKNSHLGLRLNNKNEIVKHFGRLVEGTMYSLSLIEHFYTEVYGHDQFKLLINVFNHPKKDIIYLTAIKRDFYTLMDYMQLRDFRKNMQVLSREDAEKTLNLFIKVPSLFKKATEKMHNDQQKKIAEIEEQKKRILGKEIPESF